MILDIKHLSKSFGTHEVLKDIDFSVSKGDVTSIIGASGSGKSTLLNMLAGLEHPTKGEIVISGKHIEKLNEKQRQQLRDIGGIKKQEKPVFSKSKKNSKKK